MKKIFALTSVLALAACGVSSDIAEHDASFAGCERIATSEKHLLYKCPASQEWYKNLKKQKPTAMFKYNFDDQGISIEALSKDKDFAYVEVVLNESAGCKENFHSRVIIKPVDGDKNYAFIGCK